MENLTWTCHFCKKERPDAVIYVHKTEVSPVLTFQLRYCGDNPECFEGVKKIAAEWIKRYEVCLYER